MTFRPRILVGIFLAIAGLLVVAVAGVLIAVNVSPKPFAWFLNRQFATGVGIKMVLPPLYQELRGGVRVAKDIEYPSRLRDNRLDVFSPAGATGPTPTILWVHGGGFIGGDKSGVETWATLVAARGYTVVSINYALAPASHYPGPLVQIAEAWEFIEGAAARFPSVDPHHLILGGDSAGAQLAVQFVALQLNPALRQSMQLTPVLRRQDLLGVVLYCGPYDLRGLYDAPTWFGRFFVRQLGWAYFGIRDWKDTPQAQQASVTASVTTDFPPAFITDGNSGSFEGDARRLETSLRAAGVRVDSLYYPISHGRLGHEYQFDYSLPEALESYQRTLAFLAAVTSPAATGR